MYFLGFVSNWLSSVADEAMGTILTGIRTICFWLCTLVYSLVVDLYNFFDTLCRVRILNGDIINEVSKRIGLILGLVMFSMVIFSLIKMLIDPDKIKDKEMGAGAIVKKVIFVVALLGIQNGAFNLLYDVQNYIIESDVISKMILPYTIAEEDKDKFGNLLSASLMKAFYYKEDYRAYGYETTGTSSDIYDNCGSMTFLFYNQIFDYNKYDLGYMCLRENIELINPNEPGIVKEDFIINFNGIFAVAVGCFVLYMIFMYCFKVGIRMIQLAFLEIIAPMAIISYLSPKKDNMFSKWRGLYFSTYIDVFIRIAIINFVVFIICVIFASNAPTDIFNSEAMSNLGFNSGTQKAFFTIVIILSLLTFAKKAPDLIKELLPNVGKGLGFGLGMKDIVGLKELTGMAAGAAIGAPIGLIGGAFGGKELSRLTGLVGGALGGAFRGGAAGFKAKDLGKAISTAREKQAKANMNRAERIFNNGSYFAGISNSLLGGIGMMGSDKILEEQISAQDALEDAISKDSAIKALDTQMSNLTIGGADHEGNTIVNQEALEAEYKYYKNQKKIAAAKILHNSMESKNDNIYLYAQRLSRQDSEAKKQIKSISSLVKSNAGDNQILDAYKEFGSMNDERKNTRERNRIQKGK